MIHNNLDLFKKKLNMSENTIIICFIPLRISAYKYVIILKFYYYFHLVERKKKYSFN
jgi:hypothetical protein